MASYIEQATINLENNGAQLTGKSVNRNDTDTKKSALGDIKNAQTAGEQELSVKKVQIEIIDEENESGFASSEDVDYHLVWAEKCALSDDEINSWITMLNIARNMNPNEETEPPPPIPEEEITFQSYSDDDENDAWADLPIPDIPLLSPGSHTSEYHSLDDSDAENEQPLASNFLTNSHQDFTYKEKWEFPVFLHNDPQ